MNVYTHSPGVEDG